MEYQKTNVNAFLGLDSNQRPELIKNEEASDIENLRFEKLGYLVNRNGVEAHPLYMSRTMQLADINGVLWSIGTVGITEYVIEKPWGIGSGEEGHGAYDNFTLNVYSPTQQGQSKFTDRFMVYCIRIPAAEVSASTPRTDGNNESNKDFAGNELQPENRYTWRYKAVYLLMPLTGPNGWRDQFAFAPNANKLSLSSTNTGSPIPANGTNQLQPGTYYRVSSGTANLSVSPYASNIEVKLLYGTLAAATTGTIIYVTSTSAITLPNTPGQVWHLATLSFEPQDISLPSLYATFGSRSILKANDKPNKLQIYAPSRWLGVHNQFAHNGVPKDLNWIEHYVSMQQYRESIVISDMTNGDMILVDEFMESEYNEPRKHRFTLRENALALFDVDDVVVDFGLGVSAANGGNEGVKAPMALYKFYLPRNRFTATRDNYLPTFSGARHSPSYDKLFNEFNDTTLEFQKKWVGLNQSSINAFMAFEWWTGGDKNLVDPDAWQGSAFTLDVNTKYTFSNQSSPDEYDDLFGALTLANPSILEDDQVSSDVYIWDDYEINYYPVSGIKQNRYFLTALDRSWDKTSSAGTKVVKIKNHTGVEQDVPLGIWRYRFVWYLGNGEYSAPSSELVIPDILFSGMKDSEIIDSVGSYQRPFGISSEADALKTNIDVTAQSVRFINENAVSRGVRIFKQAANPAELELTSYGANFLKVKEALFTPDHIFAARYSSTSGATWPTNWSTESLLAQGNLSVSCTLYPGNDYIPCTGTIADAGNSSYKDVEVDDKKPEILSYQSYELPLNIVMFASTINSVTYNSLFTNYGVIRTAYQNIVGNDGYSSRFPSYSIVMDGTYIFGVGLSNDFDRDGYEENGTINEDFAYTASNPVGDGSGKIFFNIHSPNAPYDPASPPATAADLDRNNEDDDLIYPGNTTIRRWSWRNMTQVRGVQSQDDRLVNLKSGLPSEVMSRIVLSGMGELQLCDFTDTGTIAFQTVRSYEYTRLDSTNRTNDYLHRYINLTVDEAPIITGVSRKFFDYDDNNALHGRTWFTNYSGFGTQDPFKYFSCKFADASQTVKFNNLKVCVSLPGERLTISEQLSMYVPASLLFNAPHVKLIIPSNRVPRRARQLLVFRTRASHDNAWQPHDYGLVKTIDLMRDQNGKLDKDHENEVSFLDDVKSDDLDYSYSIPDYDGFIKPIKSRFCLPLNERVFYGNIKESYRPHTPRSAVDVVVDNNVNNKVHRNRNYGSQTELEQLWSYKLFDDAANASTNMTKRWLYYFLSYNDQARSFSLASCSGEIDRDADFATTNAKPVFFCMPSAYDTAIENINIYRLNLSSPISKIEIKDPDNKTPTTIPVGKIYFVVQGAVEYNGQVYYTNDIIQTFDGNDVGYDGSRVNRFINYFNNNGPVDTDRGYGDSYSYPILYDITNYFDGAAGPDYIEKIGTIKPEDEGIFYDNNLPAIGRLPIKQIFQNEDTMPGGLRWSEPYQPNKIKLASLMEIRSGDGDQITGLAMLYGNLIVLKERSIHRLAVQGSAIPVSRVDEISNNVGCVAPNTVITVNNTLYFLSWAGFYKYDNNQLSKIDGKFSEELQLRLRSSRDGVINPAIRDASCGWNPTYRELYLTFPVMSTNNNEGDYQSYDTMGISLTDNKGARQVRGTTYAINVDTGLVTKYRYMDDSIYFTDPSTWPQKLYDLAPTQRAPRVYSRLYYTNTLGQLRSGECLPPRTVNYLLNTQPVGTAASMQFMRVTHFIESPTKDGNNKDKSTDDYLMFTLNPISLQYEIITASKFLRIFWSSKSWTMEDKSVLKRIRKVFAYISASDDPTILRGVVHTSPEGETATLDTTWQYSYVDSRPLSPRFNYSVTGEIMGVPTEAAGQSNSPSQNRGERHTFNIEGSGSFQMEYFGFYWKPINQYER